MGIKINTLFMVSLPWRYSVNHERTGLMLSMEAAHTSMV